MADTTDTGADEAEIRRLLEERAAAMRAKDVQASLARIAPDVVTYELAPPLRYAGDQARDPGGLQEWYDSFTGPVGIESRDLKVFVGGNVAFCHGLALLTGERAGGEKSRVWFRETVGLRRTGGRWEIVHAHASVPLYMDGSGKAALDLEP
ncbi:YybH family protein [Nocardiopsis composta]|uniref:PhnB protein n=1 Tax=Nocardiopsis composta TaxID=157465 RepID=A0A7W8QHH4_9ACTN|nr:nuclear transport factor 2 family protein [Nocardiopsis composta]MBB5430552.1 PhnB protein [Nocardiopsis composta]